MAQALRRAPSRRAAADRPLPLADGNTRRRALPRPSCWLTGRLHWANDGCSASSALLVVGALLAFFSACCYEGCFFGYHGRGGGGGGGGDSMAMATTVVRACEQEWASGLDNSQRRETQTLLLLLATEGRGGGGGARRGGSIAMARVGRGAAAAVRRDHGRRDGGNGPTVLGWRRSWNRGIRSSRLLRGRMLLHNMREPHAIFVKTESKG